jgi:HPt (histidine-containing phosphotransfer) domain-containing protein
MADQELDWRDQPPFDRQIFASLDRQTGGAAGTVAAVYRRLLPERQATLLGAIAAADRAAQSRAAHLLKSGAHSLGLLRLANLCDRIERSGAAAELGGAIAEEFAAAAAVLDDIGGA